MHVHRLMMRRWTGRLADEAGFAVPTVTVALLAAFGLAAATVVASVGAQGGTVRDQDSKQALAAAEAGANQALLTFNRYPHTEPLCPPGSTPGGGWCQVAPQELPGVEGASFAYAVRPTSRTIEIVSTGDSEGVTRRVEVVARSAPELPFADANVIGLDFVELQSQSTVTADVATNGDITVASSAALNCDYAQVGEDGSIVIPTNGTASCTAINSSISLPPINQGDVATNNSNGQWVHTGKVPSWNPATRVLGLSSNTQLTFPSGNYSLCRLTTSAQNNIFIPAGATVRIYFDSPEACGLPGTGEYQLEMHSNSRFTTIGDPATGEPDEDEPPNSFALLFVGSDTVDSRIHLASNTQVPEGSCEQDFVVYAPRTDIVMASNSTFCGGIAGASVTLNANADIFTNELAGDFEPPNDVPWHYQAEEFVECSAAAGATPNDGC